MITAISSYRPMAEDLEWKRHQLLANRSWNMVFSKIVYFGAMENELSSPRTKFVESEQWPTVKALATEASTHRGFTAILNADIVVMHGLRKVIAGMGGRGQTCASSRRYHFDSNSCDYEAATLGDDRGRDIFIARQDVWKRVAREIPVVLRIGSARWDAWMTDFFRSHYNAGFVDFTAQRLIFHPIHEGRRRPYDHEIALAYPR